MILLLATLLSVGCQHSENRYLDRAVERHEVVGEWVATAATLALLRDEWKLTENVDAAANRLVLRPDGSCSVGTYVAGEPPRYVRVDRGCRWELTASERQELEFHFEPPPADRAPSFFFGTTTGGQLAIWQYAEDPDQWRYIEFARRSR
jgi:hypothetical protein